MEEHEKFISDLMSDNTEKSKSLIRMKAETDSFIEDEIILKREMEAHKEMITNLENLIHESEGKVVKSNQNLTIEQEKSSHLLVKL